MKWMFLKCFKIMNNEKDASLWFGKKWYGNIRSVFKYLRYDTIKWNCFCGTFIFVLFECPAANLKINTDKLFCFCPLRSPCTHIQLPVNGYVCVRLIVQRFSRAGPRGRGREWSLSWLLSNNRLEEVCDTLTKGTFSSRLLLSNQDKGCTPSAAHSLPLPLPPGFC